MNLLIDQDGLTKLIKDLSDSKGRRYESPRVEVWHSGTSGKAGFSLPGGDRHWFSVTLTRGQAKRLKNSLTVKALRERYNAV